MGHVNQHNASGLGILRVSPEHVYGEGNFVGDALTGRLGFRPEFERFQSIIVSLSKFVMNRFWFKKSATKMPFHNQGMLKGLTTTRSVSHVGEPDANVALLVNSPLDLSFGGWTKARLFSKLVSTATRRAAQAFLSVYSSSRPALYRHWIAALNTIYLPFFIRKHTALAAAFCRAVERIPTMLFAVATKLARPAHKSRPTLLAGKGNAINTFHSAIMCVVARTRTELSHRSTNSAFVKLFSAIQTGFHMPISSKFGHIYQTHLGMAIAKGNA